MKSGRGQNIITNSMHHVWMQSILYFEDGTTDYVFDCCQPLDLLEEIPWHQYFDTMEHPHVSQMLFDVSEVRREAYMWDLFESQVIPKIHWEDRLFLNGTFTKKIFDYIRKIHRELGFYDPALNRFLVPEPAKISLGVDIKNLVYTSSQESSLYISQWAIRANIAALNDGIITRIYAKKEDAHLTQYLAQSHVQLQRLAYALGRGWDSLPRERTHIFTLLALAPSLNEAPSE
jgi:hypothetical protein